MVLVFDDGSIQVMDGYGAGIKDSLLPAFETDVIDRYPGNALAMAS